MEKFTRLTAKACPLALPPSPRMFETDSLLTAFNAYDEAENARRNGAMRACRAKLGLSTNAAATGYALAFVSAFSPLLPTNLPVRREQRRDFPVNRSRWQFSQREEYFMDIPAADVGSAS